MTTSQADRQIKFRVIHDGTIIGYEQLTTEGWKWMCPDLNPDSGLERWILGVFGNHSPYKRDRFTGLFDKNEKEIYEGDLIKFLDGSITSTESGMDCDEFESVGEVFWCYDRKGWDVSNRHDVETDEALIGDIEIVGNIYQNSNLLQG